MSDTHSFCICTINVPPQMGVNTKSFWLTDSISNDPSTNLTVSYALVVAEYCRVTSAGYTCWRTASTSTSSARSYWAGDKSPVSRTLLSRVIHVQVGNPGPSRTTATTRTVTSHSQLYPSEQHTKIFTDVCPCCLSQLIWGTTLSISLQNCGIVPHRVLLASSKAHN